MIWHNSSDLVLLHPYSHKSHEDRGNHHHADKNMSSEAGSD